MPPEEPSNGRVTTAQMMTYVGERFDKLREEVCNGFDKLERSMAEARKDFVARNEFEAVKDAHETRMESQADDIKRIIWWLLALSASLIVAVGGAVLGYVLAR